MNQKRARDIRQGLRSDIEFFGANQENRSDGSFSPVQYSYDYKKGRYVKTGKGIPFRYSADSPRKIYRDRKEAYKKDISDGIPFEEAICFLIEPQISQYENIQE